MMLLLSLRFSRPHLHLPPLKFNLVSPRENLLAEQPSPLQPRGLDFPPLKNLYYAAISEANREKGLG